MKLLVDITPPTHPNICSFIVFMTFFQCDVSLAFMKLVSMMMTTQPTIPHNVSSLKKFLESALIELLRTTRTFKTDVISSIAFQGRYVS